MTARMLILTAATVLVLPLSQALANHAPDHKDAAKMPAPSAEAIDACKGKAEGDKVSVKGADGKAADAVCEKSAKGELFAHPGTHPHAGDKH